MTDARQVDPQIPPRHAAREWGIERLRTALGQHPGEIRLSLQLGGALFQAGRVSEAAEVLGDAARRHPGSVEAWCNLSGALVTLERADEALAAADRALALAPNLFEALLNRGDAARLLGRMREAVDAYSRAVEQRPDALPALNKLAGVLRTGGEDEAAGKLLEHALSLAPDFGLALVNLGTLRASQRRLDEARSLLERALSRDGLDPGARRDAAGTLSRIEEYGRTDAALARAVEEGSPAPLEAALRAPEAGAAEADDEALDFLRSLADGLARDRSFEAEFSRPADVPPDWSRLEAVFSRHLTGTPEAVDDVLRRFDAHAPEAPTPEWLDLAACERAIRLRRARRPGASADGPAWEAWLRFSHAVLTAHRPECLPGHFKLVTNRVGISLLVRRVAPRCAAGTLRRVFTEVLPAAPAGPGRAALAFLSVGYLHPFSDGNGRLARWLLNGELEHAGFHPLLFGGGYARTLTAAYAGVLQTRDLAPMLELLAQVNRFTRALLRDRAARVGASD